MENHSKLPDRFDFDFEALVTLKTLCLAMGFSPKAATTSYEVGKLRQRQCVVALSSTLLTSTMGIILIISSWLYINLHGARSIIVDAWICFSLVAYFFLVSAWLYNFNASKHKKSSAKKFFISNIPGGILAGISLGCLPVILDISLSSDNYIGTTILVGTLTSATAWAFPLFNLTLLLVSTTTISFLISHYYLYPFNSPLLYLAFILLSIGLLGLAYLAFFLFWRWIQGSIQYQQKSVLLNLFLKDLEESSNSWLWKTNTQYAITYISDNFLLLTGLSRKKLGRLNAFDYFFNKTKEAQRLISLVKERKHFINFRIPVEIKGVEKIWSLTGHPDFDSAHNFLGYRGAGTDITTLHSLELAAMEKDRYDTFSQISTSLSHDFNNLLASISLRLELIKSSPNLDSVNDTYASEAIDICKKFAKITSQMLIYSRKETLNPKNVSLDKILNLIIDEVHSIEEHNISFDLKGDNYSLWLDEMLFYNTLLNIIDNAIFAMQQQGKIFITKNKISITESILSLTPGDYVRISIEDSGPGFDEVALKKAFEPFYTQHRYKGGSGLGLSMAQGFAKQSNGNIFISNGYHGAKVELYLPLSAADNL